MPVASAGTPPFRAEVIGSLLRPRRLKDAGRAAAGGPDAAGRVAGRAGSRGRRVVARQEEIGLPVVTDGEFARSSWFGFFFEGLDGFRLEPSHFKFKDADGWPSNGRPAWPRPHPPARADPAARVSSAPTCTCAAPS